MRFRTYVRWALKSAGVGSVSLAVGAATGFEPLIAPFVAGVVGTIVSTQFAMVSAFKLRRLGITPLAAWGERWRAVPAAQDRRTHGEKLTELVERMGGASLAGTRFADLLRNAADDRLVIHEITSALTPDDRALVPDVGPTADALLDRIGALASGLERLDRDLPGSAMNDLAARIAAVEAEPSHAPDRERRLTLLTRQRGSLQELQERRDAMQRQIDSASMALRTLRLDIVKLRTMGVNAAVDDVTSATQEARALSRDLGYVLDAAEESRRL
jgi:hypothetical protein